MKEENFTADLFMLIDVSYLNPIIGSLKNYFESTIGRPLQDMDISDLLVYLALDSGLRGKGNNVQVAFVYDEENSHLQHCVPSDLVQELNNVAFDDELGQFTLNTYQPELVVGREALYLEFLRALLTEKGIKKYVLISAEEYSDELVEILKEGENKDILQFRLRESEQELPFQYEILAFPVMQALGIKGSELN